MFEFKIIAALTAAAKRTRARLTQNSVARNSLWMMSSNLTRIVLQGAFFILLARALPAAEYGFFSAVAAVAMIAGPFAGWGSAALLVKRVSQQPEEAPGHWARALLLTGATGVVLVFVVLWASRIVLPGISPILVLLVTTAEFLGNRTIELSMFMQLARGDGRAAARTNVAQAAVRLAAALVVFAWVDETTAVTWGVFHLGSSVLVALWRGVAVTKEVGIGRVSLRGLTMELREGLPYCFGIAAQNALNDADKVIVVRLGSAAVGGPYAAAYRVLDVALMPMKSILWSSQSRFFVAGREGVKGSFAVARALLPSAVGLGATVAMGIWLCAPLVSWAFGPEYREVSSILRWLALIPLLRALHQTAGLILTGAGLQWIQTTVYVVGAAGTAMLAIVLVPINGWRGAAFASLVGDGFLVAAMWTLGWILSRRDAEHDHPMTALGTGA